MLNSKETLKRLHKRFPLITIDELFDILDCYIEEPLPWWNKAYYTTATNGSLSKVTPENCLTTKITYNDGAISNIKTTDNIQLTANH